GKVVKSLSSSRREVLVDCFHVYTYHIGYLLPGSAVLQHSAAKPALVRSTISSRSISAIIHSLFSLCSAVLSMK
ncbi:hypothetical protein, partial [Klebsiella pneumoniae]|uniref:hypothetical protein n=1 Tax=Klebsiella pneumoniae TaxID=573 RepID=UPI003CC84847